MGKRTGGKTTGSYQTRVQLKANIADIVGNYTKRGEEPIWDHIGAITGTSARTVKRIMAEIRETEALVAAEQARRKPDPRRWLGVAVGAVMVAATIGYIVIKGTM